MRDSDVDHPLLHENRSKWRDSKLFVKFAMFTGVFLLVVAAVYTTHLSPQNAEMSVGKENALVRDYPWGLPQHVHLEDGPLLGIGDRPINSAQCACIAGTLDGKEIPAACGRYPENDFSMVWCFVDGRKCNRHKELEEGQFKRECHVSEEIHRDVGRLMAAQGLVLPDGSKPNGFEDLNTFLATKVEARPDISPRLYYDVSTKATQYYWNMMLEQNADYRFIRPGNGYTTFVSSPRNSQGDEELTVCTIAPLDYTDPTNGKTERIGFVTFKSGNLLLEPVRQDFIVLPIKKKNLSERQMTALCASQAEDLPARGTKRKKAELEKH